MGRIDDARARYEGALEKYERLLEGDSENVAYQSHVAMTLNNLGNLLSGMGRIDGAKERYEGALEMRERLLDNDHENVAYQSHVATTLNNLGNLLSGMGRIDDAKGRYEGALEMYERLLEGDSENVTYQSRVATTLNNIGLLLSGMGRIDDARARYEGALEMRERLLDNDHENVTYQSDVATTLNNLGALLSDMGRIDDAKERYEDALEKYGGLLDGDPENVTYQSYVAATLNNLGALLSDMGRIDDAKERYEDALEKYGGLLDGDPGNVTYQSYVAMTLNNLGALLSDMGRIDDARARYEGALNIYTEPMQYMTIRAKSRTIINIIQLISKSAEEATNQWKKQEHFGEVYAVYNQHKRFFIKYDLDYEHRLAREAGLGAHIQHLMLNAEAETETDKRIDEYGRCVKEIGEIAKTEDDEGLKGLWSSVMYYLEGRQLINEAIKSDPPEKELVEQAVEQFRRAKDRYNNANVCYCIYTVLLELESVEVLDDAAVTRLKGLLHTAIDSLPGKMDETVKPAFGEIELLLEKRTAKVDPDLFIKLNRCITKIEYYALREHLTHISQKVTSYLKEPFSPNVTYCNWTLEFTFDDPAKVAGKLTIKAGDNVLFDKPLGIRDTTLHLNHIPRVKKETITFTDGTGKTVTRPISYSDEIRCDDGYVDVYILEHDCRRAITSNHFNIAIVQLKYYLYKEGSAIKVRHDEQYLNKIRSILNTVKEEADLIVFPEFSIPFTYLPILKQYSDANGIAIVAGSHYVTDANLDKYGDIFDSEFGEFGENDLLKNISPVIIPSQEKILHTEKVSGAKVERALFFGEGMTHGTLNRIFKLSDDVTCGVMICFDFVNDDLRQRITDACNIIVVPQSNPGTERFHKIGKIEIDNPREAGNKAYIMAGGIFTFGEDEKILGGDSAVILTLDKNSHEKREDGVIKSIEGVKEEFILLSALNMGFFAARDTQQSQTPIITKLIHVFEEKDKPQDFLVLLQKIESCKDRNELKKLLTDNGSRIRDSSPLMHERTKNLENMSLDRIKDKCRAIVVK
jgi:tetratricopeptide (TPR) repeat protein